MNRPPPTHPRASTPLLRCLAALLLLATSVGANHVRDCEDASDVNNYFINFCEEKCICEVTDLGDYAHVCYREREEYTCMTTARRDRYHDTYKAVTTPGNPQYHQMKQLLETHGGSPNFNDIHQSQWFLPWHRWYAKSVEDILRNEDCRVTLPWWRWSKKSTTWWSGSPFLGTSSWLGTNPSGSCVDDGAFDNALWTPPTGGGTSCLKRNFFAHWSTSTNSPFPLSTAIGSVLLTSSGSYNVFSNNLEGLVHDMPHVLIHGDMITDLSPRDPTFFLHHGYIDQLWDRWQRKSNSHLVSYCTGCSKANQLPHTVGVTPSKVGDNFDLHESRVKYVSLKSNPIGRGHLTSLPACMMLVASHTLAWKKPSPLYNLDDVENSLYNASEYSIYDVPQIMPETPDYDTLYKRYALWFRLAKNNETEITRLEQKVEAIREMKHEFAKQLTNTVTNFKDPASTMLGYDVEWIQKKGDFCSIASYYNDKGKCKRKRTEYKALRRQIKKMAIYGGEVVNKEDKPKNLGVCVKLDCEKKIEALMKDLDSNPKTLESLVREGLEDPAVQKQISQSEWAQSFFEGDLRKAMNVALEKEVEDIKSQVKATMSKIELPQGTKIPSLKKVVLDLIDGDGDDIAAFPWLLIIFIALWVWQELATYY